MIFTKRMKKILWLLEYYRRQRERRDGDVPTPPEPPVTYAGFDPDYIGSNITLSNSNKTATFSSSTGVGVGAAMLKGFRNSGKFAVAFEIVTPPDNMGNGIGFGISNPGTPYDEWAGESNTGTTMFNYGTSLNYQHDFEGENIDVVISAAAGNPTPAGKQYLQLYNFDTDKIFIAINGVWFGDNPNTTPNGGIPMYIGGICAPAASNYINNYAVKVLLPEENAHIGIIPAEYTHGWPDIEATGEQAKFVTLCQSDVARIGEDGLTLSTWADTQFGSAVSQFAKSAGVYYDEFLLEAMEATDAEFYIGLSNASARHTGYIGNNTTGKSLKLRRTSTPGVQAMYNAGATTVVAGVFGYVAGDVFSIRVDNDARTFSLWKNGVSVISNTPFQFSGNARLAASVSYTDTRLRKRTAAQMTYAATLGVGAVLGWSN